MVNIYRGDYRKLFIPPALLLLFALLQIPHLKFGIDFTGGTLIVLQLKHHVDPLNLQEKLAEEGVKAEVRVYKTSFGERAEIEIGKSPELEKADELRDEFSRLLKEVAKAKSRGKEVDESQLRAVADQLFEMADMSNRSADFSSLRELDYAVQQAYERIYELYTQRIVQLLRKYVDFTDASVASTSPALGRHFLDKAIHVALLTAGLSVLVVFFFFRTWVPALAILIGAMSDILIALGIMAFLCIPLSLASFSALLMLVGFSLDTDILLTMRMLKRKGDPREKAFEALKTGVTMSITAIFAFAVLYIVSLFTHITFYREISTVALAGLFGDLFATWGINAVLLLLHVEGKL